MVNNASAAQSACSVNGVTDQGELRFMITNYTHWALAVVDADLKFQSVIFLICIVVCNLLQLKGQV